jgi:hypothetical protein
MTPAFGSFSVGIAQAAGGDNSNVSVLCPTGIQVGDLMLFFACNDAVNVYTNQSATLTPLYRPNPTDQPSLGYQGDLGSASWYRFATGADVAGSTSYTVNKNPATTTSQPNIVVCARYTGVDPNAFPGGAASINVTNKTAIAPRWAYDQGPNTLISANAACPAPTNPSQSIVATDLVVRCFMVGQDVAGTGMTMSAAPAGWTKRTSTTTITQTSAKFNVGIALLDQVGATDTSTINASMIGMWDNYTVSLPAPPPPAGFMPFFGARHHEDDLVQRPSGLYVQRRRIVGVRPDGGRDRVLVHS